MDLDSGPSEYAGHIDHLHEGVIVIVIAIETESGTSTSSVWPTTPRRNLKNDRDRKSQRFPPREKQTITMEEYVQVNYLQVLMMMR